MTKILKIDILPLLILVALILVSLGPVIFGNYLVTYKYYIGILLIGISIFLYFKNKKLYIYVFSFTLLFGLFNLIDVFYISFSTRIGFLNFNPIFLGVIFLFMTLNNLLYPKQKLSKKTIATMEKDKEILIQSYERKFASKLASELKEIALEGSGYVTEAKIAAKNVLNHKFS